MPRCPMPRCGNEVGRLWKHERITALGYPEGICTTCYCVEKAAWPSQVLLETPAKSVIVNTLPPKPIEPIPILKPMKTCKWCGKEKPSGILSALPQRWPNLFQ